MKNIVITKNILTEKSDILNSYFKDIAKYPLLDKEEEYVVAKAAINGDEKARERLITSNLRFVITCAKQFVGQGVPLIDLINSGNKGLIEAIVHYQPDRGYRFLSYAVWYIRREITRAIYNTSRTIRYPVTYITKITKAKKAYEKLYSKNECEPSDDEIKKATKLTDKQLKSVITDKSYCSSIEAPIQEDSKVTVAETIAEEETPYSDVFTKETISKALRVLNEREYKVITEYYGLEGQDPRPIKEIAKEIGVGDERVRQLRKGAIKKLNKKCGNVLKTLL